MATPQASEHDIQCAIATYYRRCGAPGSFMTISLAGVPLHHHGRAKAQARAGYRAGTPDMVFCFGGETLWIELKRDDGGAGLSDHQESCHAELRAAGHVVHVCHGLRAAVAVMADFGVVPRLAD